MEKPARQQQRLINLWDQAVLQLPERDKIIIESASSDKLDGLTLLHAEAERIKHKSLKSRWKYTRKSGETVILRDVFEKLVRWIDLFKQIGDIAVQYDPTHASLPWAGVRLILQMAVNDIKNFASVIEGLTRVAALICRYSATEALYINNSSQAVVDLEKALLESYTLILSYLSQAKQFLEQGTTKRIIKSAIVLETQLETILSNLETADAEIRQWKDLVDRSDYIRNSKELEGLLRCIDEPLRRMDDRLKDIQDDLQDSQRGEILQWLSREPYIEHHQQTQNGVLPGSGQWLLFDPQFKRWKDESASAILWLHGIQGSGKSKLVSIVIQDMVDSYKSSINPHPIFFYCSRNSAEPARSNPRAILASLARQLSCIEAGKPLLGPTLDLYKNKAKEGFASGQLQITESCDLIMQLVEQHRQTTIILDALDECDPATRVEFLQALERILQDSIGLVKSFISSRDDQDIVLQLSNYPNLEIYSQRNSEDISRFVKGEVKRLVQAKKLLHYSKSKAEMEDLIVNKVVNEASGMFRWASLQLQYLSRFKMDADIKTNLGKLPPDLDSLYTEIYERLSTGPGDQETTLFKNVLRLLLCAQQTLKTKEFLIAISYDPTDQDNEEYVSKDLVLDICNNLVVFDSQLDTFRFAHLSVREFLERLPEFEFSLNHGMVAEVCLGAMLYASHKLTNEDVLLQQVESEDLRPGTLRSFFEYADLYWAVHCKFARQTIQPQSFMARFTHVLCQDETPTSCILLWNDRLRTYDERYVDRKLWNRLQDARPINRAASEVVLFVSCAFDFEEQVERTIAENSTATSYINRKGRNVAQVAARHGSCATLAVLTKETISKVVIDSMVLEEAASSDAGSEALTFLLDQRGPDIHITDEVVKAAAGNHENGKEIMTVLLNQRRSELQITEEVLRSAVSNSGSGKEVMTLLLDRRGGEVHITNGVLNAAFDNFFGNLDVIRLLFDRRGTEFCITQEIVEIAAGNSYTGLELMTYLLEHRKREVHITPSVIRAAAGNHNSGLEIMHLLIDRVGAEVHVTEDVMKAAVGSFHQSQAITELLLDRWADEIEITEEIVIRAARNMYTSVEVMTTLLSRRGDDIQITEKVLTVAAKSSWRSVELLELLFQRQGDEIRITEKVVKGAAANYDHSDKVLSYLLDRQGSDFKITEDIMIAAVAQGRRSLQSLKLLSEKRSKEVLITGKIVQAAASNVTQGKQMIEYLLCHRKKEVQVTEAVVKAAAENFIADTILFLLQEVGEDFDITEDIVKCIAKNNYTSVEVMAFLLDGRGEEVKITEEVMQAAAGNSDSGPALITLLLDRREQETKITERVLVSAAANYANGRKVMMLLLDRRGKEVRITQEIVKAAASNHGDGVRVIKLLLERRGDELHITREILRVIVENSSTGKKILDLLLDQRGDEVHISEEIVEAAIIGDSSFKYGNGKAMVELLLERRGREFKVTEAILKATARNRRGCVEIMALFLKRRTEEIQITEEVVKAVAGNMYRSAELMTLLLNEMGDTIKITEKVIMAAARNPRNGREVMKLLFERREQDVKITDAVLEASAENHDGGELIKYIRKVTNFKVTEAMIKSAAIGGQERTLRLFDQWSGVGTVDRYWLQIAQLRAAAEKGDVSIVGRLVSQNIPPDLRDSHGTTPLWHAASGGHKEVVEILLATKNVDVNVVSISRRTPLFWPVAYGYVEVVKLLLSHGSKQDFEDAHGKSPLSMAQSSRQWEIVDLLLQQTVRSPSTHV